MKRQVSGVRQSRLDKLKAKLIERTEDMLRVQTNDSEYITPPKAAIECGLNYTYMALAMVTGEISVDLKKVSTAKGQKVAAVMMKSDVLDWLEESQKEAEKKKLKLPELLSQRYGLQDVYDRKVPTTDDVDADPDLPRDLIPIDVVEQFQEVKQAGDDIFDVELYIGDNGQVMVSESELAESYRSNVDPEPILDIGAACTLSDAADAIDVSVSMLETAARNGDLEAAAVVGNDVMSDFVDIVQWYNQHYASQEGGMVRPYQVVDEDGDVVIRCDEVPDDKRTHYDAMVTVTVNAPSIEQVIENITADVIQGAIDDSVTFEPGQCVDVNPNMGKTKVDLQLSLGQLNSAMLLAEEGEQSVDDYVVLVATGVDGVAS